MKRLSVLLTCLFAIGMMQAQRFYEGWEKYNHQIKYSNWTIVDGQALRNTCPSNAKGWWINVVGDQVVGTGITSPTVKGDTNKNVVTFACGGAPNKGTDSWLISPKIKGVQDGDYLNFYFVNFTGSENCNMQVLISTTGTDTASFKVLDEFKAYRDNNWASYAYSLADYVGKDIYVAFRAYFYPESTLEFGGVFGLDMITVGEVTEYDMEFVEMLSPEVPLQNVDTTVPVTFVVKNKGHKVESFDMWYLKSSDVASWKDPYAFAQNYKVTRTLKTLDTMHVTFPAKQGMKFRVGSRDTIRAWVDVPADLDRTNDSMAVTIADNVKPAGVPYQNSFDSAADISGIRIFNIRKDASTWKDVHTVLYSRRGEGCMEYAGNTSYDANDWFFTKQIYFGDAKTYELSYWYATSDPAKPQKITAAWSYEQKYQSLMWELAWQENIVNQAGVEDAERNRGYLNATARFKVEKPGYYYIGFRCTSPASNAKAYIDDIEIKLAVDVNECSEDRSVAVFPNPAQDQLNIMAENAIKNVEIYNAVGQRVYRNASVENQIEINTKNFANGLYIVKINTEKGYSTQKVNIMH